MDWDHVDAVLFDLDGVLTPTAEVHMRAWEQLFTGVLADLPDGAGDGVDTSEQGHGDGSR